MNADFNPLPWIAVIVSISIVIQTIELLLLRKQFSDDGIWQWRIVRGDFQNLPALVRIFLDFTLRMPNFVVVLWLRLFAAIAFPFFASLVLAIVLLLTTLLISVRWRGAFNGGSDSMTLVVLTGLLIATTATSSIEPVLAGIIYIAIQSVLSYFIAGVSKLKFRHWRDGSVLVRFLDAGSYRVPPSLRNVLQTPTAAVSCCWAILIFELLFPFALLDWRICLAFLCAGTLFHLGNNLVFGLNRFFFAWLATYPAIFWCSVALGR